MQVNDKVLLGSAESILKNHKKANYPQDGSLALGKEHSGNPPVDLAKTDLTSSRILKLQDNLKALQEDYTREQMRAAYLQKQPQNISQELKYNGNPLFPEYKKDSDLDQLRDTVTQRIKYLIRGLKSIQVEMENIYALNFNKPSESKIYSGKISDSFNAKGLDRERIAHLTGS